MPSLDETKDLARAAIDSQGDELIGVAKKILDNPEPGFREQKTSATVADMFRKIGLPFEEGIGITGLKAMLDSGKPGPTVAVMGELDSLNEPHITHRCCF